VEMEHESHVFRPRARLLLLLGDQLIRDAGIAVFELVKNAYDADATRVAVILRHPTSSSRGEVIVRDDGSGMSWDRVTNVWLEPGTDFRAAQRAGDSPRSPRFGRMPLGEKGVGRFAASKLGDVVELVTRADGEPEVLVEIDWAALSRRRYLADADVRVVLRDPEVFTGAQTGTQLTISGLREPWTRGRARQLYRAMTSITSPFGGPEAFQTELRLKPDPGWLDDLPDAQTILDQAVYRADGVMSGDEMRYSYQFEPPRSLYDVAPRAEPRDDIAITGEVHADEGSRVIDLDGAGVGPINFSFRIYDLDVRSLQAGELQPKAVRDYLKNNGGVRVYRDGVRIFDYGEPGDDWLDLGARRVNVPGQRLSNNQVVGAVHLSLEDSPGLVEKTNREGFVENEAFACLKAAVKCALDNVTAERNTDKLSMRSATAKVREPVTNAISELRAKLEVRGLAESFAKDLDLIETEYKDAQERLLTAAGSGLQLMLVVHEIEKGVHELGNAVSRDVDVERLRALVTHLSELMEGLGYLTRRAGRSSEKASELIRQALFNCEFRVEAHGIQLTNAFRETGRPSPDFSVRVTRRLIVATLMNLIDNAIYWSDIAGTPRRGHTGSPKRIYLGTTAELGEGNSIVVADNGTGFRDDPAVLTQALVSRRPEGMGIGLHLADQVMRAHGGYLAFPSAGDAEVPPGHDGAVVALVFKKPRRA
jgi:signal transduction histidine kinase